jgi:hypothetical protein
MLMVVMVGRPDFGLLLREDSGDCVDMGLIAGISVAAPVAITVVALVMVLVIVVETSDEVPLSSSCHPLPPLCINGDCSLTTPHMHGEEDRFN